MYIYDISRNISDTPPYDGDPETIIESIKTYENGDEFALSKFSMCNHTGTHIDAPYHFDDEGEKIGDIRLSTFYGKCSVVEFKDYITGQDIEKILKHCCKRILIKGDSGAFLTSSAAQVLADSDICLVGTDADTIGTYADDFKVHTILARRGIVIIENLDLSNIKPGHDYRLHAFPIRLDECEAAPCRAILFEQEKGF